MGGGGGVVKWGGGGGCYAMLQIVARQVQVPFHTNPNLMPYRWKPILFHCGRINKWRHKRINVHSAKSLLCDTVYYGVYSNISSNISCLRIELYKQMRILKYCQSRAVSGILANL